MAFKACNHLGPANLFTLLHLHYIPAVSALLHFPELQALSQVRTSAQALLWLEWSSCFSLIFSWRLRVTSSGSFLTMHPHKLGSYYFSLWEHSIYYFFSCISHISNCSYIIVWFFMPISFLEGKLLHCYKFHT